MTDRNAAPGHLVGLLAAIAPRPVHPSGEPDAEQWQAHLQLVTDRIWAEAWLAGASYGLTLQRPRPMLVVTAEERDRLLAELPAAV